MLITGNTPGNDMRFINDRVVATRNFANKLWNASRFMLMNLEGFDKGFVPEEGDYTLADKWILSRFAKTAQGVTANLEKFELGEAGRLIYEFIWNEFCDWYIELAKARLYDKENIRPRQTAQYVLGYVLERTLRLLHPFMPFITEEIWQHIPHDGISIHGYLPVQILPYADIKATFVCPLWQPATFLAPCQVFINSLMEGTKQGNSIFSLIRNQCPDPHYLTKENTIFL